MLRNRASPSTRRSSAVLATRTEGHLVGFSGTRAAPSASANEDIAGRLEVVLGRYPAAPDAEVVSLR
jgi:hypothetical protein